MENFEQNKIQNFSWHIHVLDENTQNKIFDFWNLEKNPKVLKIININKILFICVGICLLGLITIEKYWLIFIFILISCSVFLIYNQHIRLYDWKSLKEFWKDIVEKLALEFFNIRLTFVKVKDFLPEILVNNYYIKNQFILENNISWILYDLGSEKLSSWKSSFSKNPEKFLTLKITKNYEFLNGGVIIHNWYISNVWTRKVSLEDIKFENSFDVQSNDQIWARQILTQDVMENMLKLKLNWMFFINHIIFDKQSCYLTYKFWSSEVFDLSTSIWENTIKNELCWIYKILNSIIYDLKILKFI